MDLKKGFKNNVQTSQSNDDGDIYPMNDVTGAIVKPKWRGTSQDKVDMETLGRCQVLRVSILLRVSRIINDNANSETLSLYQCWALQAHSSAPGKIY